MISALFIPCDDLVRTSLVEFDNTDYTKQSELIGAAYLDFVRINAEDTARIVIDDSGRINNKPVNFRCAGMYPGPICGDVLLVGWNRNIDPMGDEVEMTNVPEFYAIMAGTI